MGIWRSPNSRKRSREKSDTLYSANPPEYLENQNQLGTPVEVNVSNQQGGAIGVYNNLFQGEGGLDSVGPNEIDDESFVINPTTPAYNFTVNITGTGNNRFGAGEQINYKIFYEDGTIGTGEVKPDTFIDSFTIMASSPQRLIDAVQLTMVTGVTKIGIIDVGIVTVNVDEPISLDFEAVLTDSDGDSTELEYFSVDQELTAMLSGGPDHDALNGGIGSQTLTGNGGADSFVYTNVEDGNDTITDFDSTEGDRVVIDNAPGSGFEGVSEGVLTSFLPSASGSTAGFVYEADQLSYWDGSTEFDLAMVSGLNPTDVVVI